MLTATPLTRHVTNQNNDQTRLHKNFIAAFSNSVAFYINLEVQLLTHISAVIEKNPHYKFVVTANSDFCPCDQTNKTFFNMSISNRNAKFTRRRLSPSPSLRLGETVTSFFLFHFLQRCIACKLHDTFFSS